VQSPKPAGETPAAEKVFVSWSGGKDAYLALLKAREMGLEPCRLLNFNDAGGYSRSHGLPEALLRRQAEALGLTLETEAVTWETYEAGFINAVTRLKKEGITGGVFGDICLDEHREWVEKICNRCGISPYLPLWGMGERQVPEELLRRGARVVVVAVRTDLVEESMLGRELDQPFLDYCEARKLSPCGEGGEYHTLVVSGPLFREPLTYQRVGVDHHGNFACLKLAAE